MIINAWNPPNIGGSQAFLFLEYLRHALHIDETYMLFPEAGFDRLCLGSCV